MKNTEILYSNFSLIDGERAFSTWMQKENDEVEIIASFIETKKGSGLYVRNDGRFEVQK